MIYMLDHLGFALKLDNFYEYLKVFCYEIFDSMYNLIDLIFVVVGE